MADLHISEIVQSLRCSLCDKYLSVPPISIISSDGESQKCGRCRGIKTEVDVKNTIYEKMAPITEYPCIYEDCKEKLRWGEVESHEEVCLHRTLKCPMLQYCDKTVKIADLVNHFNDEHSDELYCMTSEAGKTIDLMDSVSLLLFYGEPYLIKSGATAKKFSCQVFALFPDRNREYELEISTEYSDNIKLILKGETIFFKENEHCFRCAGSICKETSHWNSTLYQNSPPISDTSIYIDNEIIELVLKSMDFKIAIYMQDDDDTSRSNALEVSKNFLANNNTTLIDRILQCPVCEETMSSPIFMCPTGHSLCQNCKLKLQNCPTCKSPFGGTRNFALEDLADNAELLCQNEVEGCNFFGNVEVLGRHQVDCEISTFGENNTSNYTEN